MKTSLKAHFLNSETINQPLQCVKLFLLSCWRWLSALLSGPVQKKFQSLKQSVTQAIQTGLHASLLSLVNLLRNKRHLVGVVLVLVGVVSVFAHRLFLDMYSESHDVCSLLGTKECYSRITGEGWCYISWYWYFDTVRFSVAAIFAAVGLILFVPVKFSLSFIPFSILQAAGWSHLIHFTFFTYSHETVNMVPDGIIIAIGLALGFSIVKASNFLLYWENHKKRGNWQRWPLVHKANIDQALKNKLFDELTEEYYKVNKMI